MKNSNYQIFLDKTMRPAEVKHDVCGLARLDTKTKPKLVVTRAILRARCLERRIQACTPTLLCPDFLMGGKHG